MKEIMEIPSVVNLEGHQSRLQKCTAQELNSESSISINGSVDHRGDYCLCEAESSLWKPDEDLNKVKNTHIPDSHDKSECVGGVCLQQPDQVSVVPCESSPVPVTEDLVVQNHSGGSKSKCMKTDFERLEAVSNGHKEEMCPDSDPGRSVSDLPRIIKHKPSSITFSNFTFPSIAEGHAFVDESSDDGESSSEDDRGHDDSDDEEDCVFLELPVNHRKSRTGKNKHKKRETVSDQAGDDHTGKNNGYEAEGEKRSTEESLQAKSALSESMCHLMMKLDQLHLDIEEALSASSSPSDTPCTTRKKQWAAVSKSTSNQTAAPKDRVLQRPERGECPSQDRSSTSRSSSAEKKGTTKKTIFNKMTNAAGAGM